MKLDLGCGKRKSAGFYGVDIAPDTDADLVHDLRQPWPWGDGTVSEARSSHFIEHLIGAERIHFMDELWRVMKVGALATIITPYWTSHRAVQDPTHVFPPICEQSYLYFDRVWREANKLDYYPIKCHFTFAYSFVLDPDIGFADEAAQKTAVLFYNNVVDDLEVGLTREE